MKSYNELKNKVIKYLKLIGTDNNGVRHRYSIEKNEEFKNAFVKFMTSLRFYEKDIRKTFNGNDDEGNPLELKIADFNDVCVYYYNILYEVDVFYGNRKIILVIRTGQEKKRDRREKMIKDLKENSKWRKPSTLSKVVQGGKKPWIMVNNRK